MLVPPVAVQSGSTPTVHSDVVRTDEHELLRRAADGDRAAFDQLVRGHAAALYRYARGAVRNSDVHDVVQETFIAAWRQIPGFRQESSFENWLVAICRRKIADLYRSYRSVPVDTDSFSTLPAATTFETSAVATSAAFVGALSVALAQLPDRQRDVWILREVEGHTFPAIGTRLGLSADAARGHHRRARANLARELAHWK